MSRLFEVRSLSTLVVALTGIALMSQGCGGTSEAEAVPCGGGTCASGDVCCSVHDGSNVCWSGGPDGAGAGCAFQYCYPSCVPDGQCSVPYPPHAGSEGYKCELSP
jgi:hypothetical protein